MRLSPSNHEAESMAAQQWSALVDEGIIYLPRSVDEATTPMVTMALRRLREMDSIELRVNTRSGDGTSFDPCMELLWRRQHGKKTVVFVEGQALSIAASYVAAGTERIAVSRCKFVVHGEQSIRGHRNDAGVYFEDHYAADWMCRFTERDYDWWLDRVRDGKEYKFFSEEALEVGLIDKIINPLEVAD